MKRIGIFALIFVVCLESAAWGEQKPATCIDNWNQFHQSNMQRSNPCETVLNVDTVKSLTLKWSFKAGDQPYLDNTPVVENGVVYTGSGKGNVYAINAKTGAMLWSQNVGGVTSSPAVADGVVYVSAGSSPGGTLYALNAATGDQLWSYALGSNVQSIPPPTVVDGVVYLALTVNSDDGQLFALNGSTGTLLWSYDLGNPAKSSPAVADGRVYFGMGALDAATGALLWGLPRYSTGASSNAVANGLVYLARGNVYTLDARNGDTRWKQYFNVPAYSSPAVESGTVYVGSSRGGVFALNAATGDEFWNYDSPLGGATSSPTAANGVVYFGGGNNLYVLNAATGAVLGRFPLQGTVTSPAVTHGMVYVGSGAYIDAFGLADGEK
jgi:eukaryotic-like serine/threonine-protein kinase